VSLRPPRFTLRDQVQASDHVLIYEPAQTGIVATSVGNLLQFIQSSPITSVSWSIITDKPDTFPPSTHGHEIADVTGLQSALDGKQAAGSYAASVHGHAISDVTGLQSALDGKQAAGSYAAAVHGHAIADVTGLQSALDGKQPTGSYLTSESDPVFSASAASGITSGQVANWNTAYGWGNHATAGYAPASHTHPASQISDSTAAGRTILTAADAAAQRTALSVETTTQLNARDTDNRSRANHTGTQAASTIVDFNSATRAQVEGALVAGSNVTLTPSGSGASRQITIAASGGASLPTLGNWDYWKLYRIGTTNVASGDLFLGAAVSSGTNTTAISATGLQGFNHYGVFLRSGTAANGGYRYQTSSLVSDYFGTISHKFRFQFMWRTAFAGRMVRGGYLDTATSADSTDGAYFEIDGQTVRCKTANNSTRSTFQAVDPITLDVPYTFDIEVNAAGTEVRYRVWIDTNPTPILDTTLTANIPTTSARAFGAGVIATEASTTASDIGVLYSIGMGTIAGFERANGV
jgi:hypothetical protein